MTAVPALAAPQLACGPLPDPLEACLAAAAADCDRLAGALFRPHDASALAEALGAARRALADVAARQRAVAEAFTPASVDEIREQGRRLLRAWPQARQGDLAGYGAELADLITERRPSRRALEQACRALKLTRVHLPAIAEVIAAIDAAEGAMLRRAERLAKLPAYIARAEAALAPPPPRPALVNDGSGAAA